VRTPGDGQDIKHDIEQSYPSKVLCPAHNPKIRLIEEHRGQGGQSKLPEGIIPKIGQLDEEGHCQKDDPCQKPGFGFPLQGFLKILFFSVKVLLVHTACLGLFIIQ